MAMILACPECEEKIKARDEAAGRKVRCPHCGAAVPVPKAAAAADEEGEERRRPSREAVRSTERPARPRGAMPTRDEDEDDRPRSRRKRGAETKSKAGLIIALCAGAGVLLIGGGVLLFLLLGKSSGPRADRQAEMDMKVIGLAYHQHLDAFVKAPFKLEDLQRVLNDPSALQRLRDGRVVFFWGIHTRQMLNGPSNTILAHDKDAPARGGVVLFGDGSVRTISLEEFQKTTKAREPNNVPPVDPGKGDPGKSEPKDPTAGWKTFLSRSGAYSIKTPANAAPNAEKQGTSPEGAETFMLSLELPDKTAYQVMLARFPPNTLTAKPADVTLTGVRDRLRQSLGGNIRKEGTGQNNGHAWRDVQMEVLGDGLAQIRIMVVRDDLYQLMVLGPANSPFQKDAQGFFDSFVVRESGAKVPGKKVKVPGTEDPESPPKDIGIGGSFAAAIKLIASGNHRQGAELLDKISRRAPPSIRSRFRAEAASAWLKAQDKDKALAAAKAAAAEPMSTKSTTALYRWHRSLGEVFFETGHYPRAVEHLQRALENATTSTTRDECRKMLDEARTKNGN